MINPAFIYFLIIANMFDVHYEKKLGPFTLFQ